ncbi:16S rRNA (uracil(1498)-N(3))-methyltransferase, partial [Bifidobacteriaceae bacterium WP022]
MTDALFLLDTDHDNAPVLAEGIEEGWTIALPSQVKR